MKKILAVLLSAVLVLTAVLVSAPLSAVAATAPIKATPWAIESVNKGSLGVTVSDGALNAVTSEVGKTVKLNSGGDFYGVNNDTGRGSQGIVFDVDSNAAINRENEEYFMFYFETKGPVSISPQIRLTGKSYNFWKIATVEILEDGKNYWDVKQTVSLNSAGNWSQIEFSKAFSGYIKIKYTDLDYGSTNTSGQVNDVVIYIDGMGTKDSNTRTDEITVGPFFTVTSNSTSTEIEVPEGYRPDPILATPLIFGKSTAPAGTTQAPANLNSLTSVLGTQYTLNSGSDFYALSEDEDNEGRGKNGMRFTPSSTITINKGETHFLFYIETNGPLTFVPKLALATKGWQYPIKNTTVEVLKDGSDKWETVTKTSAAMPQIEFKEAFKGYVKIPYSDFNVSFANSSDTLQHVDIYVYGMGTKDSNPAQATKITTGPFFTVTSNTGSTKIEVPEAYRPQPIGATPWAIESVNKGSLGVTVSDGAENAVTSEVGKTVKLNSGGDFYGVNNDTGRGSQGIVFDVDSLAAINRENEEYFMFYFETKGPVSISPQIRLTGKNYNFWKIATVEILEDGKNYWDVTQTVSLNSAGNWSQIEFSKAFSGYIKIKYTDLDYGSTNTSGQVNDVVIYIDGMGTKDSNTRTDEITVGPFFTVTSNSGSTKIEVPEAYRPQPIGATPLIFGTSTAPAGTTQAPANPNSLTSVLGTQYTLNSDSDFYALSEDEDNEGRGKNGMRFTPSSTITINKGETHFLFYIETNGPLTFVPKLALESKGWQYPIKNTTVEVLKDGSDKWETVTKTSAAMPQIEFKEAFKGYVKIPYSDFNVSFANSSDTLQHVDIYVYGMGTKDSNPAQATKITTGPFFTVNSNSSSTEIEVPEAYRPQPIDVNILTHSYTNGGSIGNHITIEASQPLDWTAAITETMKLKDGQAFEAANDDGRRGIFAFGSKVVAADEIGFIFYLKTNGKFTFVPKFTSIDDYPFSLRKNCTVQILKDGSTKWEELATVATADENGVGANFGATAIKLDESFSGFIKIAFKNIGFDAVGMGFINSVTGTSYPLKNMIVYPKAMGIIETVPYASEVTVGPFYTVTSDSVLTDIDVNSIDGDVNVDGFIDSQDLGNIRSYMLDGALSKYLEKYGDIAVADGKTDVIDILDLVNIAKTVFGPNFVGEFSLPETVPFAAHTSVSGPENNTTYQMVVSEIESPIPELSTNKGLSISNTVGVDLETTNCLNSGYAAYQNYDNMPLGDITHIMMYVEVPAAKDNQLAISIFNNDSTNEYKIARNSPYALLPTGSKAWEHYNTTNPAGLNGTIVLPAGFKGFVKLPLSTLQPNRANKNTTIKQIAYRFAYIESANPIIVGPLLGVTKDYDKGPAPVVLDTLPTATTTLKVNSISEDDKFPNKVMLSWENKDGAKEYRIDAYLVSGNTYKRVNQVRAFTNSGTVIGLDTNKQYAFVINALDADNKEIATYAPITTTISTDSIYATLSSGGELPLDASSVITPDVQRSYTTLYSNHESLTNQNPNRGFRGYAHFTDYTIPTDKVKQNFANMMQKHIDFVSAQVAVVYFYLPQYMGPDGAINLDDNFFNFVEATFEYARENDIQLIVRFAYFTYGIKNDYCNINNQPTYNDMVTHINQIKNNGIITRNKDVIHSFQVGFVGFGGEWHSDTLTATDRTNIINTIVKDLVPEDMYIQARRPVFKSLISGLTSNRLNMIGFNHDSFTGIEDCRYLGGGDFTVGSTEWNIWMNTGAYAPQDAECQYFKDSMLTYNEVTEAYAALLGMSQVRMTTFSSENGYLDVDALAAGENSTMGIWKKMPVTEKWLDSYGIPYSENWFKNLEGETVERNVFEFIRDYLGYRFTATNLTSTKNGENLNVTLKLENHGFSAGFNLKSNIVILDADNNVVQTVEAGNPKDWHCTDPDDYSDREQLVHTVNASIQLPTVSGNYKIALQIVSHNGATARLDNNIEYVNGYNILHNFSI